MEISEKHGITILVGQVVLDQTWKYDDDQNVQNIVLINNSNTCASKILMPMVSFSDILF